MNSTQREQLATKLITSFASEFGFYMKAHSYHWNVTGANFPQYHALFDTIYTEVYASVDDFAENIRKLQAFVPGNFERYSVLGKVEVDPPSAENMLINLLEDSDRMVDVFKDCFNLAEDLGEAGLADFLAARMDAHRKHSWMLRSTSQTNSWMLRPSADVR